MKCLKLKQRKTLVRAVHAFKNCIFENRGVGTGGGGAGWAKAHSLLSLRGQCPPPHFTRENSKRNNIKNFFIENIIVCTAKTFVLVMHQLCNIQILNNH